ncbi:molecular chaperone Hsp90 [Eubacterium sp.]|uniref:molecular chaperone Hsp90 n=1 Tax=Eubacterium sp. TaxID=142586 RepID=UPI0025C516E5|nr:molecular chaperone Hsp90 [Eubacterium sp.]
MTHELKYQIIDKIREMISAPYCCQELKTKADEYLVAVGTTREDKKFRELVDEIKADILPVDAMVEFMASQKFDEETAKEFLAHAKELQAKGEKFCDCSACSAAQEVLKLIISK